MLEMLKNALPYFADLSESPVLITDSAGHMFAHTWPHQICPEAEVQLTEAFAQAEPPFPPTIVCPFTKRPLQVIPMGDYRLCMAMPYKRREIQGQVRERIRQALPSIARVAGGEAVLFDSKGIRLASVNSLGQENQEYVGQVSKMALQCMRTQHVVLGNSTYIVGALGVRVPICEAFGLGFNNNDTVAQRQRLIDKLYACGYAKATMDDVRGDSALIWNRKQLSEKAASEEGAILIIGEPGTRKGILAQAIHNAGANPGMPFVTLNCDTLDQELLEGILFGYADAAFKGVSHGENRGAILSAAEGTLVLENVTCLRKEIQERLHKAMESGEFCPIGSFKKEKFSARIIALARPDIFTMMESGFFSEQLFRCLSAHIIKMPSLAQVRADLPQILKGMVEELNLSYGMMVEQVSDEVLTILSQYTWPGNMAELYDCLRTVYVNLRTEDTIRKSHLPVWLFDEMYISPEPRTETGANKVLFEQMMEDYEAQIIQNTLLKNNGSRQRTAEQLGISTVSLWRKIKKHHIRDFK